MLRIRIKYSVILLFTILLSFSIRAQDRKNVGIGTTTPQPSVLLQVDDSSRGVLIPRTDTLAVLNYVNGLTPNPGISDGLLIFDTNLNTYVYYDLAADRWRVLVDLVGDPGKRGPQGPIGPRGDTGLVNDWRDSLGFDQRVLNEDTCGDYFFDVSSGRVWRLWCDTLGGTTPRRWVDTVMWDLPIVDFNAPNERVFAISLSYPDVNQPFIESMANDTAIVVMKMITSLSQAITVEPDEVAYVWIAGWGTTGKAFGGPDLSYAQYDISIGGQIGIYQIQNMQHIVTIGPNNPVSNQADLVGFYLSGFGEFYGDLTPAIHCRCGTPYQDPGCNCSYNSKSFFINLLGGNRYSGSANTNFVILADGTSKETTAHLDMLVVIRRSPLAQARKR